MIGVNHMDLVRMALEGRLQSWMEYYDIFLYPLSYLWKIGFFHDMALSIACVFLPFFLACLTQLKLVRPLREEKVPSRKWFSLLPMMTLSFVIFMEVYYTIVMPWLSGWRKFLYSYDGLLFDLILWNFLFSCMIVGTLCIVLAEHKSKKLVRGFSNMGVTKLKFDDVLHWSEYSMLCFILSRFCAALVLQIRLDYPINFNIFFQNAMLWTFFFWIIFLLALLTYKKIVTAKEMVEFKRTSQNGLLVIMR